MKQTILKLFTIIFFTILVTSFGVKSVFAIECSTVKDQQGPHASGHYNGYPCDNPGQYNQITKCIGLTGNRYTVTYCDANGCEEEYPEQGSSAPALCNRPDQVQSEISKVFGEIIPPLAVQNLGFGALGISNLLSKIIQLIYMVAGIIFVFMVIISAVQWIVSGGDKEAVGKARGRLTWAVIGIVFLALAWVIISVIGTITGFTFFTGQ